MNARKMIALMVAALICCSAGAALAADNMTLKFGSGHSQQHPVEQGYAKIGEVLEKSSDGRMKVQLFPNSQLGNESEMVEMTKLGTMTGISVGRYEETTPMLYQLSLPFLFRDYPHVNTVLSGEIGEHIAGFAEDNGLKILDWWHSGFRQITNKVRPIKSPADLKGLKMRTPPLENILRTMKAFGASATPIPYPELYMALKTGVVDGQENPYVNIYSEKFYEVQKYVTEVNYIYIASPFIVNLDWWNALSPEDQALIQEAVNAGGDHCNGLTESKDQEFLRMLVEDHGMELHKPSDEERAAFVGLVQPVYDFFIEQGYASQEMIDTIQATK
ncbi:MAG: TRAP transporter substrate-binding protein [bacterium]|nr:TRAP transporter substrate-binding protein [bacterium]